MIKPSDYNLINSLSPEDLMVYGDTLSLSVDIAKKVDKGLLKNAKKPKSKSKKKKEVELSR